VAGGATENDGRIGCAATTVAAQRMRVRREEVWPRRRREMGVAGVRRTGKSRHRKATRGGKERGNGGRFRWGEFGRFLVFVVMGEVMRSLSPCCVGLLCREPCENPHDAFAVTKIRRMFLYVIDGDHAVSNIPHLKGVTVRSRGKYYRWPSNAVVSA